MKSAVEDALCSLEERGIIRKAESSRYASSVVWIKKKDSTLRMCADFKVHVNDSIQNDSYPIPPIETICAGMANAKAFAKIDLKEAYWQIPLHPESCELCTINTSKGLY